MHDGTRGASRQLFRQNQWSLRRGRRVCKRLIESKVVYWNNDRIAQLWHTAALIATLMTAGAVTPVLGQGRGAGGDVAAETRPLVLSPTVQLTDLGWDDNVFRVSKDNHPIGDFTATFSPAIQATLRASRVRVTGRSQVNFIYFRRVSEIRSIDTDTAGRVELLLGRTTPYVGGGWANARHRRNFEIDAPARRIDAFWDAGIDLQLSAKTLIGVSTRRTSVDYSDDAVFLDSNLADVLGATTAINGVRFRYSLTPLTTVGAEIELDRNDFQAAAERNSDGLRLTSVVEFQPLALISGRAQVGIRKRSFVDARVPTFRGTVARIDLAYTLLGRTRFAVAAIRDLSYSYRADQRDYLQTGVELSVTQRLGNAWDMGARVGRFGLVYDLGNPDRISRSPQERVLIYGVDVGYRIERTRIGFRVDRQTRTSDFSVGRGYEDMRIGTSVSYGF